MKPGIAKPEIAKPGIAKAEIVVVGAGPAGAAAAALLSRAGHHVLLLERHQRPRESLCGEFLSPDLLHRWAGLQLDACLQGLEAPGIERVLFHSGFTTFRRPLPAVGLGLSRAYFDRALQTMATTLGSRLVTGVDVRTIAGDPVRGYRLETSVGPVEAGLVLLAAGKQSRLYREDARRVGSGAGWVGGKLHLAADSIALSQVELFFFEGGYAGLCPIEGGRLNLCALLDPGAAKEAFDRGRLRIEWLVARSPALGERLGRLLPLEEETAGIGGLRFGWKHRGPVRGAVLRLGDAAGMMAPLTGSGLAMAIESAEIATTLVREVLEGTVPRSRLLHSYERLWQRRFSARLRLSCRLQSLLLEPGPRQLLLTCARAFPGFSDRMIRSTRGSWRETPKARSDSSRPQEHRSLMHEDLR